jgi:hypothetical protein
VIADAPNNPFGSFSDIGVRKKDVVFICAMIVVLIFGAMYCLSLVPILRTVLIPAAACSGAALDLPVFGFPH